jgi:hypothetical protein
MVAPAIKMRVRREQERQFQIDRVYQITPMRRSVTHQPIRATAWPWALWRCSIPGARSGPKVALAGPAEQHRKPAQGGTLTLLLDGSEGLVSPDNVDIDRKGNILIQEDPGNNPTSPGSWPTESVTVSWPSLPRSTLSCSRRASPASSPKTRNPAASSM